MTTPAVRAVAPAISLFRSPSLVQEDLIVNTQLQSRQLSSSAKDTIAFHSRSNQVVPIQPGEYKDLVLAPQNNPPRPTSTRNDLLSSVSRIASSFAEVIGTKRVVGHGLSLPVIVIISLVIVVNYSLTLSQHSQIVWNPQDLTGVNEWTSTTRTHLAHDPTIFLHDLFQNTTIGDDTSVSLEFLAKYSHGVEANVNSTTKTFNATWLQSSFILDHGFAIAGLMAGAFEGYAVWPCQLVLPQYPDLLKDICGADPTHDWLAIEIYNNRVTTTSEKASTYLSLTYTPMSLMSTRIWTATPPTLTADGIVMYGYKKGTYTERQSWLLVTQHDQLSLTKVVGCDTDTQSNARECDRLEQDNVYVRNFATRDFDPPTKLDKLQAYGPAYAMGNFVAAGKTFVQLPAIAIMMTNTGYSETTRFATIFPFRLTLTNGKLTAEYNIYQVASSSSSIGSGCLLAAIQMLVVCAIVYNAVAHCHSTPEIVAHESRIFGFTNTITTGVIARRLGTYKFVFVQLCVYHSFNVGTYFSAVYYGTQKLTDTISFGAEGFLLVVVSSMLLDQVLFFEKYSSVRETLTVTGSSLLYVVFLYVQSTYLIDTHQVQVTQLSICAGANQCMVVDGYRLYYGGLALSLVLPPMVVNGPIHWWVVRTRSRGPIDEVPRSQLTSFEKFCIGLDARREFGCYDRSDNATPISIVHAAGFTYVGSYLVRVKDYYMVVLARHVHPLIIESSGLTLTVFKLRDGRVVSGQHMALVAALPAFREARQGCYVALR